MPDKEKVIKGLDICYNPPHSCTECPYFELDDCNDLLCRDALAILKEQEAVKPIPPEDEFGLYRCGKCHHQLFRCVDKYCSRCGRQVKWND